MMILIREYQKINYPILWGGHPARPVHRTQRMPIPQEIVGDFFNWKSLSPEIIVPQAVANEIQAYGQTDVTKPPSSLAGRGLGVG